MTRICLLTLMVTLVACASAPPPRPAANQGVRRQLDQATERHEQQVERARELESQLALAEAEVRDLRGQLSGDEGRPGVVRIAGEGSGGEEGWQEPWESEEPEEPPAEEEASADDGPRPVLRLYGTPMDDDLAGLPVEGIPVAEGPPLSVVPLQPLSEVAPPGGPGLSNILSTVGRMPAPTGLPLRSARPPAPNPEQYRRALQLVRDRQFDAALSALNTFLRDNPNHPYAPNATYWRGEVHYAQRAYRRALREFSQFVESYPRGTKVPDALLKIALCHRRMGQGSRASDAFARLRRDFPTSVAARLAAEEETE